VLAELVEGNLLAAQQEIDKLALSPRETPLTAADIEQWVANSARFDSFRLIDCMLAGRLGDCLRVAGGLQRIDVAIQAVSGALHHEISMMMGAHRTQAAGKGLEAYFRSRRIWPARQAAIRGAMNRLGMGALQKAMLLLARIDRQGKGMAPGDPWQTLDDLLAVMCTERGRSPGGAVV
jgi:DNA polymerase-3 subunit delta